MFSEGKCSVGDIPHTAALLKCCRLFLSAFLSGTQTFLPPLSHPKRPARCSIRETDVSCLSPKLTEPHHQLFLWAMYLSTSALT